ncbi:MAG: dienelactone hydrolase [Clostridiaceae bacterium BRH_c20a]|nr:MAG: dienelactone hydrolase [Clostridiaceae bacterium BRH_c20a]
MDKIFLKNLAFFGFHGVLQEEKNLGQKFFVDVELSLDLKEAGESDNVQDTVSYADIYQLVKDVVSDNRFNLIEALAENIAFEILKYEEITETVVRVRKPEAPVAGIFDYFGVEIRRKRNG